MRITLPQNRAHYLQSNDKIIMNSLIAAFSLFLVDSARINEHNIMNIVSWGEKLKQNSLSQRLNQGAKTACCYGRVRVTVKHCIQEEIMWFVMRKTQTDDFIH